jgi:hypothetical protein
MLGLWISLRGYGKWWRVLYVVHCPAAVRYVLLTETLHLGCGDVASVIDNGGQTAAESDCAMPCSGDTEHLCGGPWRLQLYLWSGTLNTWRTPANIGRYEV